MGIRAGMAVALWAAATAQPSAALAQRTPGIDYNLFGPRATCPPYLLYPPGQDLRVTVPTVRKGDQPLPGTYGINTLRELFAVLRACWQPPAEAQAEPGMQISVRLSFNRNGYVIGNPRITYTTPNVSERLRVLYRRAVMESLERCEPLPLTKSLGGAIAGRPISIRYIDDRPIQRLGA
jgi:hypothetical protein